MNYGYKIGFFLEVLESSGKISAQFIDAFLSDRQSSYKKLKRMIKYGPFYEELFVKPQKLSYDEYKKIERQKFYKLMNHLQKQGLVKKTKEEYSKNSRWKITQKGSDKLKELRESNFQKPPAVYKKEKGNELKIIIFDIPEEEKKKRTWLRETLVNLGFSMLQKSVWMGNYKLPGGFIKDLEGLDMLSYVHIFSVNKIGTLK